MRIVIPRLCLLFLAGIICLAVAGCSGGNNLDKAIQAVPTISNTSLNIASPTLSTDAPSVSSNPVKISSNGRYLLDQNNQPIFLFGDSPWSIIVQLTSAQADTYLANRQQKGVNIILVNLLEHKFATNAPKNINGDPPFTGANFATPNEAYFAHADYVISQAAARGITVLLDPLYLGYNCADEGWCSEVKAASTADLQSWGQYVGNRYKAYSNIIWVIGGDTDPTTYNVQNKVTAFVNSLLQADSTHLVTAHNNRGQMAVSPWPNAPWLTVNSIYTDYATTYQIGKSAYDLNPAKPFFQIEAYYENVPGVTASQIRAQAYWTVLSGGMGFMFGNCPLWGLGTPAASFCPSANTDWVAQMEYPGIKQMSYVKQLFTAKPWQDLVPDWQHAILIGGYGTYGTTDYATAESTPDGSLMIAYLPSTRTVSVDMSKFTKAASANWYDPTNGNYYPINGSPFANTGVQQFTPPGNNSAGEGDWVLVLDTHVTITVTNPNDRGQIVDGNTAGTLSNALVKSKSGDTINFNLSGGGTTVNVTQGSLPNVPAGVKLLGTCDPTKGPTFKIIGTKGNKGLILGGGNSLYGLYISGFTAPLIKAITTGAGSNKLNCVRA